MNESDEEVPATLKTLCSSSKRDLPVVALGRAREGVDISVKTKLTGSKYTRTRPRKALQITAKIVTAEKTHGNANIGVGSTGMK